jgi:2-polyprenyl-3-methyl-5-hydroxy-6-metoxy-1,4-benzoquinol methylase
MSTHFRACPVCRNFNELKVSIHGELKPTFQFINNEIPAFRLLECHICTTIYQSPLPSDEIFRELYIENDQFTSEEYVGERSNAVVNYLKNCVNNMMGMMQKEQFLKVLEIGSGLSWMCRAVKEMDKHSYTTAQDVTSECKDICTWVDKYIVGSCEDNFELLKDKAPYDIISLTHVIEHLSYPVDFLIRISPLLSERGVLFITAPYQPIDWKKSNNNMNVWQTWSYNHVPAHLQYLTEESIKAISKITNLSILSYSNQHDNGQAFELMLGKPENLRLNDTAIN